MPKTLKLILFLTGMTVLSVHSAICAENQPNSEGAASLPASETQKNTEIILNLGNESNPVDGPFGPFTYGFRGSHQFQNAFAIEAGYIRLHEPKTGVFDSSLDEAQLTLKLPETKLFAFAVTAWENRMIDMYTKLGGVELTRKGPMSVSLGAYFGKASREDVSAIFRGAQISLSAPIGPVEVAAACLFGKMDQGSYRKCGLEGAMHFREETDVPLGLTAAIEERYFDFGNGGPVSDPRDEYIFILGLEVHLENIHFYRSF
jgi:hypothetical protein